MVYTPFYYDSDKPASINKICGFADDSDMEHDSDLIVDTFESTELAILYKPWAIDLQFQL